MIRGKGHWLVGAAATALVALGAPALAQDVEAGIQAWQAGSYEEAVRNWRPLADRGDQDAQFNLGHAYRLGRGVPQNMNLAEQWYERAARAGHVEAQAMYGLILFQNGRRQEAMPYIQSAAERGDQRAQYVYGTALFNGDIVAQDWPRAYAFMSRAAAQGLPYAQSQLAEMENHLTEQDRNRGVELARAMERQAPTQLASAAPAQRTTRSVPASPARSAPQQPARIAQVAPPASPAPPRVVTTNVPPSSVAMAPAQPRVVRPAPTIAAPAAVTPAPGGRWRVQLGAFSSEANARRAWSAVSGRLPGLQPNFVRAGALIRLQAGPLATRAAAEHACAGLGQACFPVGS